MRDLVNVDIGARCDGGTSNAAFSPAGPPVLSGLLFYPLLKDRGLGRPPPPPLGGAGEEEGPLHPPEGGEKKKGEGHKWVHYGI